MLQQFLSHLRSLIPPDSKSSILAAVSGGVDSMVLLHLLQQTDLPLGVAHCNFGLRGNASDKDEKFINEYCRAASIPFYVKRFDTVAFASERKISIQMAARELRYQWFEELAKENNYAAVATAHQASDVVETVLLNLTRGTGISGLAGIPSRNGIVIRPLLFARRDDVLSYAEANHIAWREDESNRTDHYQRNFIRHRILPSLRELNPSVERTMLESANRLEGEKRLVEQFLEKFRQDAVEEHGDRMEIHLDKLRAIKDGAVLLWELIKGRGFTYDACLEIVKNHQPGKQFLSRTHCLTVDRALLIVAGSSTTSYEPVLIRESTFQISAFDRQLCGRLRSHTGIPDEADPEVAHLNFDRLTFPLTWRVWKDGDRFIPFGMKHQKKISDFLIDLKIPRPDKENVTVLLSGDTIVWVVGYRVSEDVRIDADTQRVLSLTARPLTDN